MSGEGNNKNVPVIKQETLEKLLQNFKEIKEKFEKEDIGVGNPTIKDKILLIVLFFIDNILKEDDLVKLYSTKIKMMYPRKDGAIIKWPDGVCFFGINDSVLLDKMVYKDIKLTKGLNEEEMEEFKQYLQFLCKKHNDGLVSEIFSALYVKEQKKNEHLNKKNEHLNNLVLKSQEYAKSYGWKSILLFCFALGWFLLCWFAPIAFDIIKYKCGFEYSLPNDYFGEIFVFLSKLLFKLPSFVLCLVGVKFLYLFVQYKTEEREFSMLGTYLEQIPKGFEQEKAELVKQLALHFFPDKKADKISQSFLQELMLKMVGKRVDAENG